MSAITGNPFVFCLSLLCLSFVTIFALWFIERARGHRAPQLASLAPELSPRPLV